MSTEGSSKSYRRGEKEVTFTPSDLIAVAFVPGTDGDRVGEITLAVEKDVSEKDASVKLSIELSLGPLTEVPTEELTGSTEDFTELIRLDDVDRLKSVLNAFLSYPEVQWTGPLVAHEGRSVAYLTQELVVQIGDPADTQRVLDKARSLGYEMLRLIPYGAPDTYHLRAKEHPGYKLLADAGELMEIDGVLAEPNLGGTAVPDAGAAGYPLSAKLWDRKQIRTEAAWQQLAAAGKPDHGDKNIVLAVVDSSFDVSHPSLRDYRRIDFRRLGGHGKVDEGSKARAPGHGMRVAGVAAAAGEDDGVLGVAPNCRVIGLVYPATEVDVLDMYLWTAGIDPRSPRKGFPKLAELSTRATNIAPGDLSNDNRWVHVVATSVGFAVAKMPISPLAAWAFDRIAEKGRGGKGSLLFFSAGNSNRKASLDNSWAAHENNFGIAASTLDPKDREVRAAYSNYHRVELCAPSSATLRGHSSGLIRPTATIGMAIRGDGSAASRTGAAPGGGDGSDSFGGTSSATPLAAGVAALVLSARPELTHGDVRTILRGSAVQIDPEAKDEVTAWRDEDDLPARHSPKKPVQSWAYGFGRVDAKKAVAAALAFDGYSTSPIGEVSKPPATRPSPLTDGLGLGSASLILGAYHLIFALLLIWWPYSDGDGLAGISLVLGGYHFVVFAVLKRLRRPAKDDQHEDDPALESPDPNG